MSMALQMTSGNLLGGRRSSEIVPEMLDEEEQQRALRRCHNLNPKPNPNPDPNPDPDPNPNPNQVHAAADGLVDHAGDPAHREAP